MFSLVCPTEVFPHTTISDSNECTVRLHNRSLTTTLAVLTPIALPIDSGKELKVMGEITHFISFELQSEDTREKIAKLQVQLQEITGMGKPTKIPNLHLTLAVLSVLPSELKSVCAKVERAMVSRFRISFDIIIFLHLF